MTKINRFELTQNDAALPFTPLLDLPSAVFLVGFTGAKTTAPAAALGYTVIESVTAIDIYVHGLMTTDRKYDRWRKGLFTALLRELKARFVVKADTTSKSLRIRIDEEWETSIPLAGMGFKQEDDSTDMCFYYRPEIVITTTKEEITVPDTSKTLIAQMKQAKDAGDMDLVRSLVPQINAALKAEREARIQQAPPREKRVVRPQLQQDKHGISIDDLITKMKDAHSKGLHQQAGALRHAVNSRLKAGERPTISAQ